MRYRITHRQDVVYQLGDVVYCEGQLSIHITEVHSREEIDRYRAITVATCEVCIDTTIIIEECA